MPPLARGGDRVGDALVDRLVLVQDRAVDVERDEPRLVER
jgi:hypothetical protein